MDELRTPSESTKNFSADDIKVRTKKVPAHSVKRAIISISQDYLDLGFQGSGSWIRDWGFWILKKLTDIGS
jgi:hypothetical protein